MESAVETVDTQVYRLYDQLASLDQVAIRAREMEEQSGHLRLFSRQEFKHSYMFYVHLRDAMRI